MKQAGFEKHELVRETGFKSSPVTTGALFRAEKRLSEKDKKGRDAIALYGVFFGKAFAEGVLDTKTKYLTALGAALATWIEPLINQFYKSAIDCGATDEELPLTLSRRVTK